jgi:hypothetical protein
VEDVLAQPDVDLRTFTAPCRAGLAPNETDRSLCAAETSAHDRWCRLPLHCSGFGHRTAAGAPSPPWVISQSCGIDVASALSHQRAGRKFRSPTDQPSAKKGWPSIAAAACSPRVGDSSKQRQLNQDSGLAWRSGFSGGATDLAHHRSITPPHSRVLRLSSNDALLRYEPVARGAPPQFGKTAVTTRDEA